ncbi:Lipoprotein signal peptidase [Buchnera aphidicola (Periphyllus testudinaceus)]|uniref:signal peptidase II n=1 Tax=Buchnera aphidicola TaxID=9 RepID=UPI003463B606
MNNFFKKKYINYFLINLIILLDFYTKKLILKKIKINHIKKILSILNFFYIKNYGLIFGIFSKKILQYHYLYKINIFIIFIIIFLIYYFFKKKKIQNFAFIFLIGGSIGNLIDRIKNGFIIDFIDLHYKNFHFPTFNISDISISLGLIALLLK